jgi:RNA polymerase sigma-70 factor (ECF subfamily)
MEKSEINIEDYYVKYGPMVLRRCRSILRDEDAAFDAMQDVFVRLMTHRDKLRDEFPSSLLYRMATNICLNILRGRRSSAVSPDSAVIANLVHPNDEIERLVANDSVEYLFSGEKLSTKDMAYMHYVDKMTFEELAEKTGLSASGARRRLRTFRDRIQHLREEVL